MQILSCIQQQLQVMMVLRYKEKKKGCGTDPVVLAECSKFFANFDFYNLIEYTN